MIEYQYIRDINAVYLVIKQINYKISDYTLKMVTNNSISGILAPEIRLINNTELIYYNITSMKSLNKKIEGDYIDYKFLNEIMITMIDIIENSKTYLLNENDFILSAEYIFVNSNSEKIHLCYMPGYNQDIVVQMKELSEYFLNNINHEDKSAVISAYGLYKLSREGNCVFNEIKKIFSKNKELYNPVLSEGGGVNNSGIRDHQEENMEEHKTGKDISNKNHIGKQKLINLVLDNFKNKWIFKNEKGIEIIEDEKEISTYPISSYIMTGLLLALEILIFFIFIKLKVLYNSFGNRLDIVKAGTTIIVMILVFIYIMTLLFNKSKKNSKIISFKRCLEKDEIYEDKTVILAKSGLYERCSLIPLDCTKFCEIPITIFPFLIGKNTSVVNFIIDDNKISRIHAKIEKIYDEFYITDLNSTNGTFVDDVRINSNVPYNINHGNEIKFAEIIYTFTIVT